jgi:hypothetical protein
MSCRQLLSFKRHVCCNPVLCWQLLSLQQLDGHDTVSCRQHLSFKRHVCCNPVLCWKLLSLQQFDGHDTVSCRQFLPHTWFVICSALSCRQSMFFTRHAITDPLRHEPLLFIIGFSCVHGLS